MLDVIEASIAGLAAAVFMTLSEFPFYKKWGMSGVGEWQVDNVIYSRIILRRTNLIEESGFPWKTVGTAFTEWNHRERRVSSSAPNFLRVYSRRKAFDTLRHDCL